MSQLLTTAGIVRLASVTQGRASRLASPSSLFGWWHERKFVRAIDHFAGALRHLPQEEVESASPDQLRHIREMVDAIVNHIETFIARHGNSSLKRVEQDRHLVKRIYELRATFEKLARRVTAQPGMTDLRWKIKLDTAHRDNP
jgi:hypothetical protein